MNEIPAYTLTTEQVLVIKDDKGEVISRSFDPEQTPESFIAETAQEQEVSGSGSRSAGVITTLACTVIAAMAVGVGEATADESPVIGHATAIGGVLLCAGLAGAALVGTGKASKACFRMARNIRDIPPVPLPSESIPQPQ